MAQILKGKAVADSLTDEIRERAEGLKKQGKEPTLAIVRLGENPGDLSYERGALKRAEAVGIQVRKQVYDVDIDEEALLGEIRALNEDDSVDGVLLFRPLPAHLDEKKICEALDPAKDVDGITSGSMAGVFTDSGEGFPPCTAAACMELLDYYGVDLCGKQVTVFGRSLVIGKPAAMMAMKRNATVTICHSRTTGDDFQAAGHRADVVIAAIGRAKMIGQDTLGSQQVILDVGINVDEDGKLCGDVDFQQAEPSAAMITPVPGGVGSVTTAILMKHVVEAAERSSR